MVVHDVKQSKVPMRKCIGCNEMKPKRTLTRVVRTPDTGTAGGTILLDSTGKLNGRGAYLCPSAACLQRARKRRSLERAFKCAVDSGIYDALENQLNALSEKL